MPLKRGCSRKTQSHNIKEMMDSYKATGKIGNTKPKNASHAQKIAIAASYSSQKKCKRKKKT